MHHHHRKPACYENHPGASTTERPLMMFVDHKLEQNTFDSVHADPFLFVRGLFAAMLLWALSFQVALMYHLDDIELLSFSIGATALLSTLCGHFLFNHLKSRTHHSASIDITTQNELKSLVSRRWKPVVSAWIVVFFVFTIQGIILEHHQVMTENMIGFWLFGVMIWSACGMFTFSGLDIDSKALLYTDTSSIEQHNNEHFKR